MDWKQKLSLPGKTHTLRANGLVLNAYSKNELTVKRILLNNLIIWLQLDNIGTMQYLIESDL